MKKIMHLDTIIYVMVLLCVHMIVFTYYAGPVFVDELGYLSNAAWIAGLDWKEVAQYLPYYAPGSSLLYALFFLIFKTPTAIYRGIIIFNIILCCIIFFMLRSFIMQIFTVEPNKANFPALVCSTSPFLLLYKNYALSEIPIMFFYMAIVLSIMKYTRTAQVKCKYLAFFLSFLLITTHNRTIGSVVCVFFLFIFYDIYKKQKFSLVVDFLIIIIGTCLFYYIKHYLLDGGTGKYNDINSFEGASTRFSNMLSLIGIPFSTSAIAKIWSVTAVYGIFFVAGLFMTVKLLLSDKGLQEKGIYIFVLSSFLLELCITAIYMVIPSREDNIYYIRYFEYTIIPIVGIGVFKCLYNTLNIWTINMVLLIDTIGVLTVNYIEQKYKMDRFLSVCIPGMMNWVKNEKIDYWLISKLIILFCVIFWMFKNQKTGKYILYVFIMLLLINSSYRSILDYDEYNMTYNYYNMFSELSEKIKALDTTKIIVAYHNDFLGNAEATYLQYYLPDQKVEVMNIGEINEMISSYDGVIIASQHLISKFEKYNQVDETSYYVILASDAN